MKQVLDSFDTEGLLKFLRYRASAEEMLQISEVYNTKVADRPRLYTGAVSFFSLQIGLEQERNWFGIRLNFLNGVYFRMSDKVTLFEDSQQKLYKSY